MGAQDEGLPNPTMKLKVIKDPIVVRAYFKYYQATKKTLCLRASPA